MPVYNAEKYLAEAIDSVLSQTYTDFEFLIINDGSTDGSLALINTYEDPRIRVITRINGGVSAALNTGLANASGRFIVRFDGDDICYPTRIEQQYDFMINHPDYVIAGSNADYINKEGDYIFTYIMPGYSDSEIREKAMQVCPFIHSAVIYRKQDVLDLGGYEVKAHTFEDYFLWIKLLQKGKACNFSLPLIKVRFNPESVTVDSRDYTAEFRTLHKKALTTGVITDDESVQILKSIHKLNPSKKEFSYNRMLAKKYLWNNYQPAKARKHLAQALKIKPFDPASYSLFILSLLPKKLINSIYSFFG